MNRLSAAQARELAGPTVDERVDAALELIRTAAECKKRSCNLTDSFWVNGGYGSDRTSHVAKQYDEAVAILKHLGYTVEFFYEELQFVNMYTIVRW